MPLDSLITDDRLANKHQFSFLTLGGKHITPNIEIFPTVICACFLWPSVPPHFLRELCINCLSMIIWGTVGKDDHVTEATYAMMDNKPPANKFMVSVNMPHIIWTGNRRCPSDRFLFPFLETFGMNCVYSSSYFVSLHMNSCCCQVSLHHHFSCIWMPLFSCCYCPLNFMWNVFAILLGTLVQVFGSRTFDK